MTTLSAIAMVGINPIEAGAVSGLFNMLRKLGFTCSIEPKQAEPVSIETVPNVGCYGIFARS
jgi:hypothetical protein